MKFIHIADVHLGAEPEGLRNGKKIRGKEIWDSFERIIELCEMEQADLLLIAGDLFHRQPLLRELKEVNELFRRLSRTKVVLIAGNHDHIKSDSYYTAFRWCDNVYPLFDSQMEVVTFPELGTSVSGFSYHQKEIVEPLYDQAYAPHRQPFEILLAHGGDERHIPVKREALDRLGYSYVAMGHIHKPMTLKENRIAYAGALEPIDINDTGAHGFVRGEMTERGVHTEFVPFAKRSYVHLQVSVDQTMTNVSLKEQLRGQMEAHGTEHLYRFILEGFRDPDIQFDLALLSGDGNVVDITDCTKPAYDFEKIRKQNEGNLLGRYIESLQDCEEDSVAYMALCEGVQALLETKRGGA